MHNSQNLKYIAKTQVQKQLKRVIILKKTKQYNVI